MSNGTCDGDATFGKLVLPGETESGSAGTQPDKGFPGRRCDNGASGPWSLLRSGAVLFSQPLDTGAHASENRAAKPHRGNGLRLRILKPDEP